MSEPGTRHPVLDLATDAWYVWLGVAAVSLSVAGVALSLPAAAPPAAGPVADAVDAVAASPNEARTTVDLAADAVRLGPQSVALRTGGNTATAPLAFGPVVPVTAGPLNRVLSGAPPRVVFDSPEAFADAVASESRRRSAWRPAPDRLIVRRVSWRAVDATLVG
jgi:hypothetical protein